MMYMGVIVGIIVGIILGVVIMCLMQINEENELKKTNKELKDVLDMYELQGIVKQQKMKREEEI